jgi:hypothetical protein
MGFLPNGQSVLTAREEDSRVETKDPDDGFYLYMGKVGG